MVIDFGKLKVESELQPQGITLEVSHVIRTLAMISLHE